MGKLGSIGKYVIERLGKVGHIPRNDVNVIRHDGDAAHIDAEGVQFLAEVRRIGIHHFSGENLITNHENASCFSHVHPALSLGPEKTREMTQEMKMSLLMTASKIRDGGDLCQRQSRFSLER